MKKYVKSFISNSLKVVMLVVTIAVIYKIISEYDTRVWIVYSAATIITILLLLIVTLIATSNTKNGYNHPQDNYCNYDDY